MPCAMHSHIMQYAMQHTMQHAMQNAMQHAIQHAMQHGMQDTIELAPFAGGRIRRTRISGQQPWSWAKTIIDEVGPTLLQTQHRLA